MFECHAGHITNPGVPMKKVVVETRQREYYEMREGKLALVGKGHETVKEIRLCPEHATQKV